MNWGTLGRRALLACGAVLAVPAIAMAVVEYATPSGSIAGANVLMWLNGTSKATPTGTASPMPVQVLCTTDPTGAFASAAACLGTQDVSGSAAMSTSAADIWAAATTARVRVVLLNTDQSTDGGGNGIVIWCRWGTAGAAPAAAHGVGSFPLAPGGGFDIAGPGTPQAALNCIAESGTPNVYAEKY